MTPDMVHDRTLDYQVARCFGSFASGFMEGEKVHSVRQLNERENTKRKHVVKDL